MTQKSDKLRYEVLILTVPEITADEISSLESDFSKVIKKYKGDTLSFERWGKYRLAYEVKRNDYGVYFLSRFELPEETLEKSFADIRDLFDVKRGDIVMRYMLTHLAADMPLEYKRPESLEEAPRGEYFKEGGHERRRSSAQESAPSDDSDESDESDDDDTDMIVDEIEEADEAPVVEEAAIEEEVEEEDTEETKEESQDEEAK